MPAAAVIPAPIAYIKVVAVKKLVVGFLGLAGRSRLYACVLCLAGSHPSGELHALHWVVAADLRIFYFEKIRVFKAGLCSEYISME